MIAVPDEEPAVPPSGTAIILIARNLGPWPLVAKPQRSKKVVKCRLGYSLVILYGVKPRFWNAGTDLLLFLSHVTCDQDDRLSSEACVGGRSRKQV